MFFKKYGDIVVSIFYIVLAIAVLVLAKRLPKSAVMEIGPDFMPTVVAVIILILAGILLFLSVKNFKMHAEEAEKSGKDTSDYKRVLASLVLALVYVNVLKPVGFILSTLVYLVLQIIVLAPDDKRTRKDIILYLVLDVVFTIIVYLLFRYGFKIVLPAGIFAL